jgi:hypothetical protein
MKVNELNNNDILFEADLKQLHKEYEDAKKELKHDVDVKIVLNKLKDFAMKYMAFDKKYDIKKKRITEIEATAKKVFKYIKDKVNDLKKVAQIKQDELQPLEDFLQELHDDIEIHVEIQQARYKKSTARR